MLAALTTTNYVMMREAAAAGSLPPQLYHSGVRYRFQPGRERFRDYQQVLARRFGDCDQLCAWRVAELRMQGKRAKAVPRWVKPDLMHVVVVYPGGKVEDPSKLLGMREDNERRRRGYV